MARKRVDQVRFDVLAKVWELAEDFWMWSIEDIADHADLSKATVYRLYNEETKDCRSSTLLKLVAAVGLHIHLYGKDAAVEDVLRGRKKGKRAA